MVMSSNGFSRFPQSQMPADEWRTFLLEFLYGLLTIAWYLLAFAERFTFRGLTRLEECALFSSDDPSKNRGGRSVSCDESKSSIGLQFNETHASCYVFESLTSLQQRSSLSTFNLSYDARENTTSRPSAWEQFLLSAGVPEGSCASLVAGSTGKGSAIRSWVQENYTRRYVPEDILEALGLHKQLCSGGRGMSDRMSCMHQRAKRIKSFRERAITGH